jgi:hypothetical protein
MTEYPDFESEMNGIGFSESKSLSLSGSRQCSRYGDFDNDPDFDSSECQGGDCAKLS